MREFQRDNPEEEELFQPDALSTSQLKREMIRYAADWFRTKKETSVDYRALREQLTKKVQLPCRSVGEELFANLSLEIKPILADAFLQAYTGQSEKSLEVKCCDDSGREILFCGTVLISGDNTTSCCFNAAEMKQRHCLNLWLRHLFLSAALPEYTTMTCQFEDQEYRLEPVEQSAAQRKLLELAAIREAGKVMMIPFFNEVEPVDETPNKKGQFKYEMEKYKDSVIKSISYDYNASLFFKKYDMDPAFMRKVCHAVNRIYEV